MYTIKPTFNISKLNDKCVRLNWDVSTTCIVYKEWALKNIPTNPQNGLQSHQSLVVTKKCSIYKTDF